MRKIKQILGWNGTPVVTLIALAILSHLVWFNPHATLFHADWGLWPDASAKDLWKYWNSWDPYGGLGQPNVQIAFYLFKLVWSLAAYLGMSSTNGAQISLLIPIALLGFLAPYFLVNRLLNDKLAAFVSAILYGSTTYFLIRQTAHIPIAFVYALAPLLFAFLDRAVSSPKLGRWLLFILLLFVSTTFELRMTLIVLPLLVLFLVLRGGKAILRSYLAMLTAGTVFILLSSFWILPTYLGGFSAQISTIANRGLFGNNLFGIDRALSISESAWTGTIPNEFFQPQPIPFYLWSIPVLICFSLIFFVQRQHRYKHKAVLYFGLVTAILGILLTKQSGVPFASLYYWLYHNVPGFNLYREGSKFYILTSLGYTICVAYGLYIFKTSRKRRLYYASALIVLLVGMANLAPLLRQDFGTMFESRTRPSDYTALDSLPKSDGDRTMWLPNSVSWSNFSAKNPRLSAASASIQALKLQDDSQYNNLPYAKSIPLSLFTSPGRELIDTMSINYIAVPTRDIENENNTFSNYDEQRQYYLDQLQEDTSIQQLDLNTKELQVFKNPDARPYFDSHTNAYTLPGFEDIAETQDLVDSRTLAFTTAHAEHTQDITNILNPTEQTKFTLATSKDLVARQKEYKISYVVSEGSVQLRQERFTSELEGSQVTVKPADVALASQPYDNSRQYFVVGNDPGTALNITQSNKPRSLGFFKDSLKMYSYNINDERSTEGFDQNLGIFTNTLQDCNPYDQSPIISSERGIDPKDEARGQLLRITAQRHTACTGPKNIETQGAAALYLAFDYKFINTQQTAYKVTFDNGKVEYRDIFKQPGAWRTFETFVDVPKGAKTFNVQLYGFPDNRGNEIGTTFIDNFRISNARNETKVDLLHAVNNSRLNKGDTYAISTTFKDAANTNLIPNSSFDDGLWTDTVGDCNAYDNNPDIRMSLDPAGSSGSNAVKLEAARHIACTGPVDKVPVEEGEPYTFKFDYRGLNAENAGYYISFNDPQQTHISEKIPIADTDWHKFEKTLKVPYGATNATLIVYSYSDEITGANHIAYYDNFSLSKTTKVDDYLYLIDAQPDARSTPSSITYSIHSTVKRSVNIVGAKDGFYLSMAEGFHGGWNAKVRKVDSLSNGTNYGAALTEHVQLNGWQNAWYVDVDKICSDQSSCSQNSDGTHNIELVVEFTPQRWFIRGLIISGATLACCITYFAYDYWYSRTRRKSHLTARGK